MRPIHIHLVPSEPCQFELISYEALIKNCDQILALVVIMEIQSEISLHGMASQRNQFG